MGGIVGDRRPRLLTTFEIAELFRTTPGTVRHWRFTRTGPPGTRVGTQVLYDEDEALAWWDAKRKADQERLADAR